MIDIDKVKETWAEGEAESTFEDLDNVFGHLIAYFKSQIEDMNKEIEAAQAQEPDDQGVV